MGRKSRRARKVRRAAEFDVSRLARELRHHVQTSTPGLWSIEDIVAGRDAQLRGRFKRAARLAEAMRSDSALFPAWKNRLAPGTAIARALKPRHTSARAIAIANEGGGLWGPDGVGIGAGVLEDAHDQLANHGVAILYCVATPRGDGSRVDFEIHTWPIEWVRWDDTAGCFMAQLERPDELESMAHPSYSRSYTEVPIVHGDGRWIVISKHAHEPWKKDAAVIAGSMLWARHAFAERDWSKGSTAHGNMPVVGEMPQGVALSDEAGNLTVEAAAFLALLAAYATGEAPFGIRPSGSKTDVLQNNSTAWQVWDKLCEVSERAAARIYLGTDGTLGAVGGAPGVDIATLFGVATTIIQGDLGAIARGINTGAIEPWCAVNFGDSSLAPLMSYLIPDVDAEAAFAAQQKRDEAFHAEMDRLRKGRFVVSQAVVNELAKRYGVVPPMLAEAVAPDEVTPSHLAAAE